MALKMIAQLQTMQRQTPAIFIFPALRVYFTDQQSSTLATLVGRLSECSQVVRASASTPSTNFVIIFSSARWCGHGLALLRRATIDFILALVETPKLQITNVCSIIEQKRYQRAIAGRQWRI
jgi:hypothetical protein